MKLSLQKIIKVNFLFILLFVSIIFPSFVNAATLFVDPQSKEVKNGETFYVLISSDSQGAPINAASVDVKFDNNLLSVQSLGYSNSIFSIWAEEPTYSNINGSIHFSGGLSSPGWIGSNGPILRITFKAKAIGQTDISLSNGSVLANDGLGTNVLNGLKNSSIKIIEAPIVIEKEKKAVETKTVSTSTATSTIEKESDLFIIPVITNLPDQLTEGSKLTFNGRGISDGQILVYVQKGKNNPEIAQVNTKADGNFNIVYKNPVSSGYYKIWARNILADQKISTSSEVSYVEVINKSSFNFNGFEITYKSLIMLLSILLIIVLILLIIVTVLYIILKGKRKGRKIS